MKLLDLLKSLNTGNAVDPDARLTDNAAPQRAQLLDDLAAILAVLDTQEAPPDAKPDQPRSDNTDDSDAAPTNMPAPLLNLAAIFEEEVFEEKNVEERNEDRRQLVQSLLDELLPALEKALDDRLNQLDQPTLRRLEQALTQHSR